MSQTVRNEMVPHQNEYRDSKELSASRQWDISYMARLRQDSVGMYHEERMAYSAAHSTSMLFRQNTMFFCFTSSDILEWMEIRLESSIKTRCLQALQRIYWHSWHIFVTSWHLGTWRYPSDRPGSERKRVPLWLRMEHNKLEDWIRLQNQDRFFPPLQKKNNIYIYSLEPPKKLIWEMLQKWQFFFLISKGVGRWRCRRVWNAGILWVESRRNLFATSESWEGTAPLFGFPRKTWEELGGFCWVLSGDTYNFNKRTHVNWG